MTEKEMQTTIVNAVFFGSPFGRSFDISLGS